ncbi:MAG: T9SS type A sorting domain-containing protein [Bacteroidota bacterium]
MTRPFITLFFLSIFSTVYAQSYTSYFTGSTTDKITSPSGGICMMGGRTESDDAMRWFLERANGGDILVIRASGSDGYNDYFFSELGVTINSVESIVFDDRSASFEPEIAEKIMQAEAIWIAGGDQFNYVQFWRNSPVDSLINLGIQERNIVIGGTSAGMAILGGLYYSAAEGSVTSAEALTNPYDSFVTVDTTSFLKAPQLATIITDTHYEERKREGRHITFLARALVDYGIEAQGIACDDFTAVCIEPNGTARAFGGFPEFDDNVFFLQITCPDFDGTHFPERCEPNQTLEWNREQQAIKVYNLKGTPTGEQTFDLNSFQAGNGGVWEDWWVENGVLNRRAGEPIGCANLSTDPVVAAAIRLSPNPVAEVLFIKSELIIQQIELFDASGKRLPIVFNDNEIDIADLPSGIYHLSIETKEGRAWKEFVKQ